MEFLKQNDEQPKEPMVTKTGKDVTTKQKSFFGGLFKKDASATHSLGKTGEVKGAKGTVYKGTTTGQTAGTTIAPQDGKALQTAGTATVAKGGKVLPADGKALPLADQTAAGKVAEGTEWPWKKSAGYTLKPYKRTVDKKLTILLLENTAQMEEMGDRLSKIIKGAVKSELVCIINYGNSVMKTEPFDRIWLENLRFILKEAMGENILLYDALVEVDRLVTLHDGKIEETEKEKVRVSSIEVIGIGTGEDKGSTVSKDYGIDCFSKVAKNPHIITKYFCLTEEGFLKAAEIGFRSIGSISQKYV